MNIRKTLLHQLPYAIGGITSVMCILALLVLMMGIAGILLQYGPIVSGFALFIGAFGLVGLLGVLIDLLIEFFLKSRYVLSIKWEQSTPPYPSVERSDLPVLDRSEEVAEEKFKRFFGWSVAVYALMLVLTISIAVLKPPWVAKLASSSFVDIGIAIILLILQIPGAVLDLSFIAQHIPEAKTEWDAIVRFLLLVPPLPWMTIAMANLRYRMLRSRERVYRLILEAVRKQWYYHGKLWPGLTKGQRNTAFWDGVATLFIILLILVNYTT